MEKWRRRETGLSHFLAWLLQNVLGVENEIDYVSFEKPIKLIEADGRIHTRYIDAYIPDVKALIEQRGSEYSLDVKEHQSGGDELTPFKQAKRYNDNIPMRSRYRSRPAISWGIFEAASAAVLLFQYRKMP